MILFDASNLPIHTIQPPVDDRWDRPAAGPDNLSPPARDESLLRIPATAARAVVAPDDFARGMSRIDT